MSYAYPSHRRHPQFPAPEQPAYWQTHYDYSHSHPPPQPAPWVSDSAQQSYRVGANVPIPADGFGDSYPESSQRTILTPSPHYPPPAAVPSPHYKNDQPRSPSLSPDYSSTNSWGDVFDDSSESSRHPSAPLVSSTPLIPSSPRHSSSSVKEEPDDNVGRFIMELSVPQVHSTFLSQSLAPPTEVPLRATQAPPEMRSMMGVFRLNPFAMHSGEGRGVVAPTWCGEEARPLDEEPAIFEFQLELDDNVEEILDQPKEPLRSFSPDFELHQERDEPDRGDWGEYRSDSAYATTPPTWELDYPTSEEHFSSSEPTSVHLQPRHSSRLYEISQHYLRKNAEHAGYTAACYPSSASSMVSAINPHRMRPPEESWPRSSYAPASRSTLYVSDSPGCHSAVLPSITSANRRWSFPDSNSNYHGPFFG